MRTDCPVCGHAIGDPAFVRHAVPTAQNRLYQSPEAARSVPRGDLALAVCPACAFVSNTSFDPDLVLYDEQYENSQNNSAAFEEHVGYRVARLVATGARDRRAVEIGCGSGYFLERLCEAGVAGGTGFDTAYRGPEQRGTARFHRAYYGPEDGQLGDVAYSRHVIEHVTDPVALLRLLSDAVGHCEGALVAVETPDLRWIVDHRVFHDLFYEHCSYFTASSLTFACAVAGLSVTAVEYVFGRQYLWVEATPVSRETARQPPNAEADAVRLAGQLEDLQREEQRQIEAARAQLHALRAHGPVAIWGAGAKGVTYINLVDPDGALVDTLVDANPAKQGRYSPGTGHPISAPADLPQGATAVILNRNYLDECRSTVAALGLDVSLTTDEFMQSDGAACG
jgi:SAM-dependent methyltransferase